MELDKEARDKIIATYTTVQFILEDLEDGKDKFKEQDKRLKEHCDKINKLEMNQALMMGKLSILIIALGIGVTALVNGIIWVWGKIAR